MFFCCKVMSLVLFVLSLGALVTAKLFNILNTLASDYESNFKQEQIKEN